MVADAWDRPANIDFCEGNYTTLSFIAEAWNTFSSVPMSVVAAYGFYRARRHMRWETRWGLAWALLGVVGVGSALFHATLRHVFQAADELPMLYCNLIFIYLMLEEGSGRTRPPRKRWLAPLLVLAGVTQTVCYFLWPTVYAIFLTSYLSVIVWLVWRSVRLAWWGRA